MIYQFINSLLDKIQKETINIIDIGCHKGHFLKYLNSDRNIFSIGIDPIDYDYKEYPYNIFIKSAVDYVENETTRRFRKFVEPGCNSLLEMNKDIIVHDKTARGWYVGWNIEEEYPSEEVLCDSAFNILKPFKFKEIDFVKIDTQGNDINVVKSFGPLLDKIKYIQIESVSSHDKNIVLYKGQQILEEDVKDMEKFGFKQIFIQDYSEKASPEADVIFERI